MTTQLPTTVRAAHLDRYGSPAELGQRELALSTPAADEVLVRVRAAGLNRGNGLDHRRLRGVRRRLGGGNPRTLTGMRRFAAAALLSPFGPQRLRPLFATPKREDLATVLALVADGRVSPQVEAAYHLRDAAEALDFVHRGKAGGKVVLVP